MIEMRWNKYEVSLASPVRTQIRRPSSEIKFRVVELKTPRSLIIIIIAQAAIIKSEADGLVSQHESLMVDVERQKAETERLLVRGYEQQQRTDELLADADAARDTARRAVAKAEDTLREANETLRTLRGLRAVRTSS